MKTIRLSLCQAQKSRCDLIWATDVMHQNTGIPKTAHSFTEIQRNGSSDHYLFSLKNDKHFHFDWGAQ